MQMIILQRKKQLSLNFKLVQVNNIFSNEILRSNMENKL